MKGIKRIIREKLPETNSSSSHSVVISTKKDYTVDETLKLNSNGDLEIPSRDFGWEWEKYNDCMTKLQYVVGILSRSNSNNKKLKKLFDIVQEMTGANKVLYDETNPIEIDHNSSDIFSEIIESKESMKSFIFSKNSWLFTGNDNSDEPIGFYILNENDGTNSPKAIVTIEFGGNIGNVDIELYSYPLPNDDIDLARLDSDDCFSDISYNFSTNEFICHHNRWGYDNNNTLNLSQRTIVDPSNSCIYYINKNMLDEIYRFAEKDYGKKERYKKTILEYFHEYKNILLKDLNNKYVKVNYFVTSDEFGVVK